MGDLSVVSHTAQPPADNTEKRPAANAPRSRHFISRKKNRPGNDTFETASGKFETSEENGVVFTPKDNEGNEQPKRWICSALYVRAQTRDAGSGEWGRLLEWKDNDGITHQWVMPMELLQGDGADVRRELARQGLSIGSGKAARDALSIYLSTCPVTSRARCVEQLGWHDSVYVTGSGFIGNNDERVVFQNKHALEPALSTVGTVAQWRVQVGGLAAGNSRLVFAISAAFGAPLLKIANEDSGGFHFRGGSSTGKTTALKVASSVWGSPSTYPRVWRATTNGLEGLAALHNDGLLVLDELSQSDPHAVGEAAYLLANGQGKARASRAGTPRASAKWRVFVLSSGEESLKAVMDRAGNRANVGQEVRLADIEADAGAGMGMFEDLHSYTVPAEFAIAIKDAASRSYGAVGMEWLERIVAEQAALQDAIAADIQKFVEHVVPRGAAGQVTRVARRFGLVAFAGELATRYGLTGWKKEEATWAAAQCFSAWLEGFGGAGNREERAILDHVRGFFEAHGASRFEDMRAGGTQRISYRAGFFRSRADNEREFLVLPEVFKRDICQGYDPKTVAKVLRAHGWIEPDKDGKSVQKPRLPGLGPARCYVFTGKMWQRED